MILNDHVVKINVAKDKWGTECWMTIDLSTVVKHAGARIVVDYKKGRPVYVTDYSLGRARKLVKLLMRSGDEADREYIRKYMSWYKNKIFKEGEL